ncbi:hypothetical protein BDF14DRAFT_1831992 [Spinellus fusiger]|nr:hypothetical protein BDF14DRAFT_1831992 [Spinellus fusiger]
MSEENILNPKEAFNTFLATNDNITAFLSTVPRLLEAGVSSSFCMTLVGPILKHAERNLHEPAQELMKYSEFIYNIYFHLESAHHSDGTIFFGKVIKKLEEKVKAIEVYYQRNKHLGEIRLEPMIVQGMTILVISMMYIVQHNYQAMTEPSNHVWNLIPNMLSISIKLPQPAANTFIQDTLQLCRFCIEKSVCRINDSSAKTLFVALMNTTKHILKIANIQTQYLLEKIEMCLMPLVKSISFDRIIADTDTTQAMKSVYEEMCLHEKTPEIDRILLHLSCMLLQRGLLHPWFPSFLSTLEPRLDLKVEVKMAKVLLIELSDKQPLLKEQLKKLNLNNFETPEKDNNSYSSMLKEAFQLKKLTTIKTALINLVPSLMDQLLSSNDLAVHEGVIKQISIITNYTGIKKIVLLFLYEKELCEHAVRSLRSSTDIAEFIALQYDLELKEYLRKKIRYALPFAAGAFEDTVTIDLIALHSRYSRIYFGRGVDFLILAGILLSNDSQYIEQGLRNWKEIASLDMSIKEWIASHQTKLVAEFAMQLGQQKARTSVDRALDYMIEVLDIVDVRNKSQFLKVLFLPILSHVRTFITEKREKESIPHHPYALKSLGEIMILWNKDIEPNAIQFMSIFTAASNISGMEDEVYMLWQKFMGYVGSEFLSVYLPYVMEGILKIYPHFNERNSKIIRDDLYYAVLTKATLVPEIIRKLPDTSTIKGFDELNAGIENVMENFPRDELSSSQILSQVLLENSNEKLSLEEILPLLRRLKQILEEDNDQEVTKLRQSNELYSMLIRLSNKKVYHEKIREISAICLGLLGAPDPSRLILTGSQDCYLFNGNFNKEDDMRKFVIDLIKEQLEPIFLTSSDEVVHKCLQYTMQTLLSLSGFTKEVVINTGSHPVGQKWYEFPRALRDMLFPLLSSAFKSSWVIKTPDYPIYPSAISHAGWLKGWFNRLVQDTEGEAHKLFYACIPVIDSGNLGLALYLLPYLIVHHIIYEDAAKVVLIENELKIALQAAAESDKSTDSMVQSSLQTVVDISTYCRQWIRAQRFLPGLENAKMKKVNKFLNSIPNQLMAIASFQSKAYTQALLHKENELDEKLFKRETLTQPDYRSLWEIYTKLGDTDEMEAAFSCLTESLNMSEEIAQHEALGEWDMARVCYPIILGEWSPNSVKYDGYFNCLRHNDSFESMYYLADNVIKKNPSSLSVMNAIKAEIFFKRSEWENLKEISRLKMTQTFQSNIACAMSNIRTENYAKVYQHIQSARKEQIENLSNLGTNSYQSLHDCIFKLQLLQELETTQKAVEIALQPEEATLQPETIEQRYKPIKALVASWKRAIPLASQYEVNKEILLTRIAGLFTTRKEMVDGRFSEISKADQGELWLSLAKLAREKGAFPTAFSAMRNFQALETGIFSTEKAILYHKQDKRLAAIKELERIQTRSFEVSVMLHQYKYEGGYINIDQMLKFYKQTAKSYANREDAFYNLGIFMEKKGDHIRANNPDWSPHEFNELLITIYGNALKSGSNWFDYTMSRFLTYWRLLEEAYPNSPGEEKNELPRPTKKIIETAINNILPSQLALVLPRLFSRLAVANSTQRTIEFAIVKAVTNYPGKVVWQVIAHLDSPKDALKRRSRAILRHLSNPSRIESSLIIDSHSFSVSLKEILESTPATGSNSKLLDDSMVRRINRLDIFIPQEIDSFHSLEREWPKLRAISKEATMLHSAKKPIQITLTGTDGGHYPFLCKKDDDLRRDARVMEFARLINNLLKKDFEARKRLLIIRTYSVIPLGDEWGVLQWVPHLQTLKMSVKTSMEKCFGVVVDWYTSEMVACLNEKDCEKKLKIFNQLNAKYPPVLSKWFLARFREPSQWLDSRRKYVGTLAVMSIVGHVLGLGDRHTENILLDVVSGECVHVDLNMIFNSGEKLHVPEIVPFRLTRNLINAMGVLGYQGTFRESCCITMKILKENSSILLSVFESFINDPTYEGQKRYQIDGKEMLEVLSKKIPHNMEIRMEVERLMHSASDSRNLVQMFKGWAPWI